MASQSRCNPHVLHSTTSGRAGKLMRVVSLLGRTSIRSCSALALLLVLFTTGCTDRSPREGEAAALEARFNEDVFPSLQGAKHDCQDISSAIMRLDAWMRRVEDAGLEKEFERELREARALGLKHVARCWKEAAEPCVDAKNQAQMTRLRALSENALALGAAQRDYDPEDPRLRCKPARKPDRVAAGDCPAADVKAWRATLRYSADIAGADLHNRVERQQTVELSALMPGRIGKRATSYESWAPEGKATVRIKSYSNSNGELTYEGVAEGSPIPGDVKRIEDSRILMSITRHDCHYHFYSTGTVTGQNTWYRTPPSNTTGPIMYGTVTVGKQPINGKHLSGSATLPTVSDSDIVNNAVQKPDAYFHHIQTNSGAVRVEWEFVPAK